MEVNDIHEIEILETIKKIRETNQHIAFHLSFEHADHFAIKQLKEFKADLLRQLEELLADMEVPMRAVAA